MQMIEMLVHTFSVLLLFGVACGKEPSKLRHDADHYYRHTFPGSGLTASCLKCRPGTYLVRDCTEDNYKATCKQCDPGYYSMLWGIAEWCGKCAESCLSPGREIIAENCSAERNISCKCKPGFYRTKGPDGLCLNHKPCGPGTGVKHTGNETHQVNCITCPVGFYSNNTSLTEPCQACTKCREGYHVSEACSTTKDNNVCLEGEEDGGMAGLSTEVWIGIICGVAVFILLLVIVVVVCARRGRGPKFIKDVCSKSCPDSNDTEDGSSYELEKKNTDKNGCSNNRANGVYSPHGGDKVALVDDTDLAKSPDHPGAVNDKMLRELTSILSGLRDWQFFFRFLFAEDPDPKINKIQNHYPQAGVSEQIYQLLKLWRETEGKQATVYKVIQAFEDIKRPDLAHNCRDNYTNVENKNAESGVNTVV